MRLNFAILYDYSIHMHAWDCMTTCMGLNMQAIAHTQTNIGAITGCCFFKSVYVYNRPFKCIPSYNAL